LNRYWSTAVEADGRLRAAGISYCLIKSYGANLEFEDANLDLVVRAPLWQVRECFPEFVVTRRDRIKNRLYERNKLMLKDATGRWAMLHLHSNAGWHNICFVAASTILGQARDFVPADRAVRVTERDLEARLYVLHIIFEQFQKNPWDAAFLRPGDFDAFASEFDLPGQAMAAVRDASAGVLPWSVLRPIWRCYYRRSAHSVTVWNRFLHWGFVCLQTYRRRRAQRGAAQSGDGR
jgi:hypothetical protein